MYSVEPKKFLLSSVTHVLSGLVGCIDKWKSVSEIPFFKLGEVVFGTGM